MVLECPLVAKIIYATRIPVPASTVQSFVTFPY